MALIRKGWFWTGVGFVIAGGANWTFAAYSMAEEDISTAITFLFAAAILTGVGIFFVRVGRGAPTIKVIRKGWFGTGVALLITGMVNWSLGASFMVEKDTDVVIFSFITAAILTGVGIFFVRVGRGAPTIKVIRKGWFWTGVALLIVGMVNWSLGASFMVEKDTDAAILSFIAAAISTGVGIFYARRGGRLLPGTIIAKEPTTWPQVAEQRKVVKKKVSKAP